MVKLVYHYLIDKYMNMLHYLLKPYLSVNDLLHVNLLHAYLKELHSNVSGINDNGYIVFMDLNNLTQHLHNMNGLL